MTKKLLVEFSDESWEKVEEVKKRHDFGSGATTIRYCVSFTNLKENPEYVKVQREKISKTPEQKAVEKFEIEELKAKTKEEKAKQDLEEKIYKGRKICRQLRGKEYKDSSGNLLKCEFKMYKYLNPKNVRVDTEKEYFEDLGSAYGEECVIKQFWNEARKEPMPEDQLVEHLKNNNIPYEPEEYKDILE